MFSGVSDLNEFKPFSEMKVRKEHYFPGVIDFG